MLLPLRNSASSWVSGQLSSANITTDLARHASFQGLKCLHLSLILGIILKFLEGEINLHSEHVGLLDGVHTSLAWLEAIIAPTLVGQKLSINDVALSMVSEKKAPPAAAST